VGGCQRFRGIPGEYYEGIERVMTLPAFLLEQARHSTRASTDRRPPASMESPASADANGLLAVFVLAHVPLGIL